MENPSYEHGLDTSGFFNDLIDSRYVVVEALENTGKQQYSSSGCETILYAVHDELSPHLDTNLKAIQATVSLNFYILENQEFSIDSLTIEPYDGAPIIYSIEDGLATLKIGSNKVMYYTDTEMVSNALLMFVPKTEYADPSTIAKAIFEHSAHSIRSIHATIGSVSIASIERETLNDTVHALEITTSYPHECGLVVEQITSVEESLRRATNGKETERMVDIRAGIPVIYHQTRMIDGKLIKVNKPSRLHAENARDSLERLYEAAFSVE